MIPGMDAAESGAMWVLIALFGLAVVLWLAVGPVGTAVVRVWELLVRPVDAAARAWRRRGGRS